MGNYSWDFDRIYAYADDDGTFHYFFSPDGRGRVEFDSLEKAREETGIRSVAYLMGKPLD